MRNSVRNGAFYAGLVAAVAVSVACSDLTAINENPNAPTDVAASNLAAAAFEHSAGLIGGSGLNHNVTSTWVQHLAAVQYGWDDRYDIRSNDVESLWTSFYTTSLSNWNEVVRKAAETGSPNQEAIGRIMRALVFSHVTDLWGDVPYSEAGMGLQEDGTITPSYDPQEQIYADLIAELKTAAGLLQPGSPGFGEADFIYGGNMIAWERFANSLRLRLAMQMSEAAPGAAQQELQAALADGVFQSRDDDALFPWKNDPQHMNPWCSRCPGPERPGGDKVSATLIDSLKAVEDPRLTIYARPNADGEYAGLQNGLPDGHGIPFTAVSPPGEKLIRQMDRPTILMSYEEVQFIKAEAAQRGWIGGDPAEFYRAGIRSSMERWGVSDDEIDAYLDNDRVEYDPASGLEQIWLQKWLAFVGQGIEAFAHVRRTGVPQLTPGPAAILDELPKRLPYSESERSLNSSNLQEAVSRQGGAGLTTPVWWDAGAN